MYAAATGNRWNQHHFRTIGYWSGKALQFLNTAVADKNMHKLAQRSVISKYCLTDIGIFFGHCRQHLSCRPCRNLDL